MAKKGDAKMLGPLYTGPGKSLGAAEVGGPTGGKSIPDPLKLDKTSKKGK